MAGRIGRVKGFDGLRDSVERSRFVFGGRVLPSLERIYRELTETFLVLEKWHLRRDGTI